MKTIPSRGAAAIDWLRFGTRFEVDSLDEYPGMSEWYDDSVREVMRDRIRRVFSVYSFVPEYQKEKLKIIAAIRKEVKRKKGQVGDETREKIEEFERYLRVRKPIKPSELPTWVKEQLVTSMGISTALS